MPPKRGNQNRGNIDEAVESYRRGEGTIREIAGRFQVARTTLHARVKGKKEGHRRGPRPFLQSSEEVLANWAKYLSSRGFLLERKDLQAAAKRLIDRGSHVVDPFKGKVPGRKWVKNFMKRNNMTERKRQVRHRGRAEIRKEVVREWFHNLPQYLNHCGCADILEEPRRIFNCDETAFLFSQKDGKYICEKKTQHTLVPPGKDNLTTLLCFNAAGELAPTMVIYKCQKLPGELPRVPEGIMLSSSPSGWMRWENFHQYLVTFDAFLTSKSILRPVLLFMNGHHSKLFPEVCNLAEEKQIILYCWPPNSSHILQVGVFGFVKELCENIQLQHTIVKKGEYMNIHNFASLLKETLTRIKNDTFMNSFQKCGLFPFDLEVAVKIKCVGEPERRPLLTQSCYRKGLQVVESLMEAPLLENFRNCHGKAWTGDLKYEGLYEIWEGMVNEVSIMRHDIDKDSDIDCDDLICSETDSATATASDTDSDTDSTTRVGAKPMQVQVNQVRPP